MAMTDLIARSGGCCEFGSAVADLEAVAVPPAGDVLLCPACRGDVDIAESHWRCLEGAAWSAEPAVQLAVWRKLATPDAPKGLLARSILWWKTV